MQKKEERMDIAEVLARRRPQRIAKRAMDISLSAAALAVLGYSSQEISAALKGVDAALPVEEMIRIALKKMAR